MPLKFWTQKPTYWHGASVKNIGEEQLSKRCFEHRKDSPYLWATEDKIIAIGYAEYKALLSRTPAILIEVETNQKLAEIDYQRYPQCSKYHVEHPAPALETAQPIRMKKVVFVTKMTRPMAITAAIITNPRITGIALAATCTAYTLLRARNP